MTRSRRAAKAAPSRPRRPAAPSELGAEYRATLDALFDSVHVVDADLRVILVNNAFQRWLEQLGISADLVGRPLFEAFPFLNDVVRDEYRRALERGETIVTQETTRIGTHAYYTETRKIPIRAGGKVVRIVTVVHDVTALREAEEQRRRLDEQVQQAQRLESLGVLAGGIAHDFNNLLMAVLGYVGLARRTMGEGDAGKDLESAERAGQQAIALTQQLLTFAKGGAPRKQKAHLGSLVRETAAFCLRGSAVRAEFDLGETSPVSIDVGQIGQVVQNLVLNAREAMPAGGTVRLETRDLEEAGRRWVALIVSDTGCGIPAPYLRRIFDPYFTTKPGGSGLGLAVAHSVVHKHGGEVRVRSEVGRGATFTVLLPAAERAPVRAAPEHAARPGRALRVLVMDDEPSLRLLLGQMLRKAGHAAVPAADGREAVKLYLASLGARAQRFDAVLLDLTVRGGMGGREAAEEILRQDPGARLIVSSGYAEDPVVARFEEYGFAAALGKPYGAAELLEALARATGADS